MAAAARDFIGEPLVPRGMMREMVPAAIVQQRMRGQMPPMTAPATKRAS